LPSMPRWVWWLYLCGLLPARGSNDFSCDTLILGSSAAPGSECPSACPLWAELTTACTFRCVEASQCGNTSLGLKEAFFIGDDTKKLCRPCSIVGCEKCAPAGDRAHPQRRCFPRGGAYEDAGRPQCGLPYRFPLVREL